MNIRRVILRIFFFIYKVWCDVLIWYYDRTVGPAILCDIYGNVIGTIFDPYKLEAMYRYSGVLYDRLKHLLSYIYLDAHCTPPLGIGDLLYNALCRFYPQYMYPKYQRQVHTNHYTGYYLIESVAQSLHFISS